MKKQKTWGCSLGILLVSMLPYYWKLRKLDEGKKLCEKFCSGTCSYSLPLWTLYISINMRCLDNPSKDNLSSLFDFLKNVLTEEASSKSEALWLMAFKYFAYHRSYSEKLIEVSMVSLAKHGGIFLVFHRC